MTLEKIYYYGYGYVYWFAYPFSSKTVNCSTTTVGATTVEE